jgi:glc operon protein GlcG
LNCSNRFSPNPKSEIEFTGPDNWLLIAFYLRGGIPHVFASRIETRPLCGVGPAVYRQRFAQMPNPYGLPINLENAEKLAVPAIAEATRNGWTIAVAVVDPAGTLVYFEKMDNTQFASAELAIEKARSATLFKRPTKALQDILAAGGEGLRVLRFKGGVPVEGGIPIVADGNIVGAIGISGGTSQQDGQCAKAALEAQK